MNQYPNFPRLWMATVCSGSVRSVLGLYNQDAVLVPTYDTNILRGHVQLRAYFRRFMSKDNLCGHIDGIVDQEVGGARVQSGIYTFQWSEGAAEKSVRARFTFVLVPETVRVRAGHVWASDTRYRIATHHSSEMPAV
jgi:hypothetical protein